MTISADDVIRVSAEFADLAGSQFINVFHAQAVAGTPLTDDVVMDGIRDRLEVMYAKVDTDVSVLILASQLTGQRVFPTPRLLPDTAWTGPFGFFNISEMLPPQVAAMAFAGTIVSRTQGRKYLFPYGENTNDGGTLAVGTQANLVAFALDWITDFVVAGMTFRFGVYNPLLTVFTKFFTGLIATTFRTQRRRTPGRGS